MEVHYSLFIAMPLQNVAHKIWNQNEYFHQNIGYSFRLMINIYSKVRNLQYFGHIMILLGSKKVTHNDNDHHHHGPPNEENSRKGDRY